MRRAGPFRIGTLLLVFCAMLISGCHKKPSFPRSQFLDLDTHVVLVDAWFLDHAPRLFQAMVEYDGVNPAQKYDVRAMYQSTDGRYRTANLWNRPVPVPSGKDGKPRVIWEFIDLPKEAKSLSLQIDFTDKENHSVHAVNFELPTRGQMKMK